MTHGTEDKIMDAALKEFSEKGYAGAKTKDIATRSGLSEMTLFRRFQSKRNLFNQVLKKNQEEVIRDFNLTLSNEKVNSEEYFKNLMSQFWKLTGKHFEFLCLIILERHQLSENFIADLIFYLTEELDKIFPNARLDSKVYAFSILSFMYLSVLDKRLGRNIIDHEEDFRKFVEYSMKCL